LKRPGPSEVRRCSFCRKAADAVDRLIPSPGDQPHTFICNECVEICGSILEDLMLDPIYELPGEQNIVVTEEVVKTQQLDSRSLALEKAG
jgi:ATP-dependent protease Clp ATPase subunit